MSRSPKDPEAQHKRRNSNASSSPYYGRARGVAHNVYLRLGLHKPRGLRNLVFWIVGAIFVFNILDVTTGYTFRARRTRRWIQEQIYDMDDSDLDTPPRYQDLIAEQRALPQHNLSLPYPEGAHGRYVKFTSQINMLGWNNVLNELLMLNYLAYRSDRAYVFQDYIWKMEYYPWSRRQSWEYHAHTPLPALIGGPTAGGSWAPGDHAPRSIHQEHWDVVCSREKVKRIWTHKIKKQFDLHWTPSGKYIFDTWNKLLLEEKANCVEVIAPGREVEDFGQVFDLWLWGSDRILSMWEELRDSPVSQLWKTSALIQRSVDRNIHLFQNPKNPQRDPFDHVFAAHVRRGDYEGACLNLANWKSTFYSWNQLPYLPDRFTPAEGGEPGHNTPENIKAYYDRCLPDMDQIIKKITDSRDDYEKEVFGDQKGVHTINTLFILTNDNSEWMEEFKKRLSKNNEWMIVTSHDITFGNAQEKDTGMALDMELARKSAIFLGNGWSSFTSNILHRRLVDKKVPISNRFF
ncbi:hypothetical protein DFP72DRAFT_1018588 [Ephemerocybe angulata]|uniref:Uncharacterized protein n=1 Tax=Ephemerocybe angulata TaxID=980116 RepID=A0A8H6HEL7_9AGAR|nr:hypothetical protein DFP72DRAFT_1018588 [Tulosesus angulatus]